MSIARRFLSMARSELNTLLDYAAKRADGSDSGSDGDSDDAGLHGYSARELEEELERRRSARQEVEDAIHGRRTPEPPPPRPSTGASPGGPAGTSWRSSRPDAADAGRRSGAAFTGGSGTEASRIQKAYAALEVAPGSDFATVRKAYRTLMRRYHPDHHTESPEKQRAANEVAQRLTESYKFLEKTLRK